MFLIFALYRFKSNRNDKVVIFTILSLFVLSIGICQSEDIVYNDKNIILNGGFEHEVYCGWFTGEGIHFKQSAAHSGVRGLDINSYGEPKEHYFLQTLLVPSKLESATLSYDLKVNNSNVNEPIPLLINIYIGKSDEIQYTYGQRPSLTAIGTIHTETIRQSSDWQTFSVDVSTNLITEIQTAHEAGELLFLVFSSSADQSVDSQSTNTFPVYIDNVGFAVHGIQQVPELQGKIAFFGVKETPPVDNNEEVTSEGAINLLEPDTGKIDSIWQSKHLKPDIRWKPDGTEIAFVSRREEVFSPFTGDIHAIKPDGTELRKVTSQPSQHELATGEYPRVTLTGRILNNTNSNETGPTSVHICPLGAQDCALLVLGAQDNFPFTIPDVAVLDDPTMFDQRANLYWSDNRCLYGLEYENFIGTVINNTVDIGTISLEGTVCIGFEADYRPRTLSWKRDCSKIGATTSAAGKLVEFDATSGLPLFGNEVPSAGFLADNLECSPIDDDYLFTAIGDNNERGLYLGNNGSEPELLLTTGVVRTSPAWLSDGSGFIFVGKEGSGRPGDIVHTPNYLYHYDLATKGIKRLTHTYSHAIDDVSVSPDSRHIAFVRCLGPSTSFEPSQNCSLWLMDRINPVEMWQITETGYIDSPDWSRVDISNNEDNPPPDDNNPDNNNPDNPNGGSSGCFIENFW